MPKSPKSVKVFAPATVANLACGFDIMGLAIDKPGDFVEVIPNNSGEIRILKITGDKGQLSRDSGKNTVSVAMSALLDAIGSKQGFNVILKKEMPLGSGLGSSAASSAAGAFAVNEALGRPFSRKELVRFAMEGERVACGTAHPDNVAPCLMGGIVLCHHSGYLQSLPVPTGMYVVVIHPHVEILTRDSRAVLTEMIPREIAIKQWSNTAGFTAALYENDFDLLRLSMEDFVAEPARSPLIPAFGQIKSAAMDEAIACSISGSGPSVFAIAKGLPSARRIAAAMQKVCKQNKIKSDLFISRVNRTGVRIIR